MPALADLKVYYNVLSGHPFMSWGENVIVGIQNAIARALHPLGSPFMFRRSKCRDHLYVLALLAGTAQSAGGSDVG